MLEISLHAIMCTYSFLLTELVVKSKFRYVTQHLAEVAANPDSPENYTYGGTVIDYIEQQLKIVSIIAK